MQTNQKPDRSSRLPWATQKSIVLTSVINEHVSDGNFQ